MKAILIMLLSGTAGWFTMDKLAHNMRTENKVEVGGCYASNYSGITHLVIDEDSSGEYLVLSFDRVPNDTFYKTFYSVDKKSLSEEKRVSCEGNLVSFTMSPSVENKLRYFGDWPKFQKLLDKAQKEWKEQ